MNAFLVCSILLAGIACVSSVVSDDVPWKTGNDYEEFQMEKRGQCVKTYSGNAGGACCHFPFKYRGTTYDDCKKGWCATGPTGVYENDKKWGRCRWRKGGAKSSGVAINPDYTCSWVNGDGKGGSQVKPGGDLTDNACVNACIEKKKDNDEINGVTTYQASRFGCWCEKNMNRVSSSGKYRTCYLKSTKPTKPPVPSPYECKLKGGYGFNDNGGNVRVSWSLSRDGLEGCVKKCIKKKEKVPSINGVRIWNTRRVQRCYCMKNAKGNFRTNWADDYKSCFIVKKMEQKPEKPHKESSYTLTADKSFKPALDAFNKCRSKRKGTQPLQWDAKLAMLADDYVKYLAGAGKKPSFDSGNIGVAHDSALIPSLSYKELETIWKAYIGSWCGQSKGFNAKTCKRDKTADNFAGVVWKSTKKVGFAAAVDKKDSPVSGTVNYIAVAVYSNTFKGDNCANIKPLKTG